MFNALLAVLLEVTEPRQFNLMFKTNVGPVEETGTEAFLRPETAQGIYVNYQLVRGAMRLRFLLV